MLTTEIASEITKLSGRLDITEGIRRALEERVNSLMARFNHVEDWLAILEKYCLSSNTIESSSKPEPTPEPTTESCGTCDYRHPFSSTCTKWDSMIEDDSLVSMPRTLRCQHYVNTSIGGE